MTINYSTIVPSRFDAPFIGTLIGGVRCNYNCPGCFHKDIEDSQVKHIDADEFLDSILDDPFSEGVILAGREWTEQYDEMIYLIDGAYRRSLEIILYTHYTRQDIEEYYPELLKYSGMYIKCGEYDENKLVPNNVHYGVPLASSNQEIIRI